MTMNIVDVVAGCPRLTLPPGPPLPTEKVHDIELVVVEEGLVVLRNLVPGSARRTITCNAGAGRVVLPPSPDEALTALSDAILRPISALRRAELLESPESAGALIDGLA